MHVYEYDDAHMYNARTQERVHSLHVTSRIPDGKFAKLSSAQGASLAQVMSSAASARKLAHFPYGVDG